MKTNYLISGIILMLSITSCSSYYRMTSRIEKDGSMYREVYAYGDSAFIAGDMTHNPFLFQLDTNWQIVKPDSVIRFNFWGEEEKLNVKACQNLPVVDGEYFAVTQGKEQMHSLAIPIEKLEKNFRWFYTYYTYTATYKELADKGPIPLSNYLNKEEQMIWLRGDNAAYSNMNGLELNDKLDKLETKFTEWYNRSVYEINWEVIHHFVLQQGDSAYLHRLEELKESVYKKRSSQKDTSLGDADVEEICGLFDEAGKINYYSDLYKTNKEKMDALCEKKISIAEVFYHAMQFELTMPGRLLASNAKLQKGNTVIWKLDGFRLLAGDYILSAESRVINYWAFGATLLLILSILGGFIRNC